MANGDAAPFTRVVEAIIPAVTTAGNDLTSVLGVVREDEVVTAVSYTPNATITGANTNTRVISVVDKGAAGTGNTTVASIQYNSGVNATGFQESAVTISGTAANLQVASGDVLVAQSTHVGTGIADPGGLVRVTLSRR